MTILVLGYGNPGRGDDALGPMLVERLEQRRAHAAERPASQEEPGAIAPDLAWDYELTADRAFDLAHHDLTIFVDASRRQAEPVRLRRVRPATTIAFSTHAMTPGSVVALARELYAVEPIAYLMAIRGYRWGLERGLSPRAGENLAEALRLINSILRDPLRIPTRAPTTGGGLPGGPTTPDVLRDQEGARG